MGLESATYISGLNPTNPVGATDPKSAGDDHLRLIKSTLLNTFPQITGAVAASHVELSLLAGTVGVTGTGALVRAGGPTFMGTVLAAVINATGEISAASFNGNLNAAQLASGIIPDARFPAALPAGVALDAAQLLSGIIPNARFPATLPAISGANLTNLNASNLASGTVPNARFPATLPATCAVAEAQITDGAILARVAAAETITGAWSFTARPKSTGAGGVLSNAAAANTGGAVIVTNVVPVDVSGMNPGDIKLVY